MEGRWLADAADSVTSGVKNRGWDVGLVRLDRTRADLQNRH